MYDIFFIWTIAPVRGGEGKFVVVMFPTPENLSYVKSKVDFSLPIKKGIL